MFKKGIIAWIVSGIFVNLWGFLTCGWLFRWVYFIEPTIVYRKWVLDLSPQFIFWSTVNASILAGVFVLVYAFIYKGIPGKGVQKGLIFGLIIWLVGCLLPVIRFAMTVNTSVVLIAYWIIDGLLIYLFLGAIISAIYKK